MRRTFEFHAQAVAVAAQVSGPNSIEGVWASVSLPIIGGKDTRSVGRFRHEPVLSFESATATVEGRTNGSVHSTRAEIRVTGLNVLDKVRGDVHLIMTTNYDAAARQYQVEFGPERPLARLTVPGVNTALVTYNGRRYPSLAAPSSGPAAPVPVASQAGVMRCPVDFHPIMDHIRTSAPTKHRLHPHNAVLTSLVDPETAFQWDTAQNRFGFVSVPGLGRVYFLEWAIEPYRQSLTALRIVLDDPEHRYKGEIVIADPEENGRPEGRGW
ncbi:MAG: hypothetical protein RMK57_01210 [Bryobacterales bacterium]|nr:hypothetical protein [Bryobacteraceae bacterium]MDW8353121.1 hypothetical protein [Bryobacterales bacterium]